MAGGPMADAMKNFDMNAPEVKQQFEAMGMKPEEVVQKIMATPDLAAAFQNPRVQAAIMDCSANPMNIAKYQDDAEIMGARGWSGGGVNWVALPTLTLVARQTCL